ncbi:BQ5605_C005g03181 [Microbotryum silenes-dioicae]|uniref:phosphoserine transaminase n=1 Tax=Microbotryum silenes-dioicae TaxID=796604 RepID=A0A2X0MD94_9BASI|nr:BQ5605_C005g03181 [Microbotryum silenes-dioicae]
MNAGPSPLPQSALLQAAQSLLSYSETPGMGIAEISHRSKAFEKVLASANADLKQLLQIPDNYKILWMQGGGLTQFAATVVNLAAWYRIKHQLKSEDPVHGWYAVTGSWSAKALQEAERMGLTTTKIVDGKKNGAGKFKGVPASPDEWTIPAQSDPKTAFVYYCDNETVDGVEFPSAGTPAAFPFDKFDKDIPIVCDMSSNFLSRPVDVSKYGIIYAGAQKNLGPSGATVVIVRDDLIVDLDEAVKYGGGRVPSMLSYKQMAANDSMYNTPPTFTIYVCSLVLRSLLESPPYPLKSETAAPLSPLAQLADAKSSLVYSLLDDETRFYLGTAHAASRSRMNPTFRIKGGEQVEKDFVKLASEKGIMGVGGHRSVGGIRTSIYNAVTLAQVETLVEFMKQFRAERM